MAEVQINAKRKATETPLNEVEKHPYPYLALAFVYATATLQSSFVGGQAVMEIFFSRFVFACSGSKSKALGTVAVNIFIAVNQFTSLTGGILADWFGNFFTQNISNVLGTIGIVFVFIASWQYTVNQPHCCVPHPNISYSFPDSCHELDKHKILSSVSLHFTPELAMVCIIIGCFLYSLGNGQTNAIQSVFVGDQFPEGHSSAKEKSFSWFYLFMNVGSLASESGVPIGRQSLGFVITFLILGGSYVLATVIFVFGFFWYARRKPQNQICCKSTKPESEPLIESERRGCCSVDNRKQVLRICGVYLPLIVFWALFFQQNSTWVLQGAMMNCYIGKLHLPPDMMPSINDLMVIILIPTLDYLIYPHLKSTMNIKVKPLQKIVTGMVFVALSFLFAAILQLYITEPPVTCRGGVSIMWQVPQLLLVSFAEVLVAVTGLEFAYSQSPRELRNLIQALWFITQALGAALNAAIALIELPLLYEFILYTGLMCIVMIVFIIINWNFKYR